MATYGSSVLRRSAHLLVNVCDVPLRRHAEQNGIIFRMSDHQVPGMPHRKTTKYHGFQTVLPTVALPRQKNRAVEDWSPSPARLTRSEEVVWELSYSVIHHVETSGALRYMRWMMLAMVSVASGCVMERTHGHIGTRSEATK